MFLLLDIFLSLTREELKFVYHLQNTAKLLSEHNENVYLWQSSQWYKVQGKDSS